ncbi:MAG: NAD-dependent epimerase/dehydratase family protein [Actinomycetota bacterium]|nr:NAD-dependent epimerase/dehydratase family protein [Actinomycetota bacterium]
MTAVDGRRVLITGIGGELAGRLARELEADDRVAYLGGVDVAEPRVPLSRTEFIRADLGNPLLSRVLDAIRVDTIVHLSLTATPRRAGGRARMKERNVLGTMQLLGAAQKASSLRRLVMKSTTAVYGSTHADPALFREEAEPPGRPLEGYSKDAMESESYARALGRRRRDVGVTILRLANVVGPEVDTSLSRYFSLMVVPTVLGYDPRLQLCHEVDAVEMLRRATLGGPSGAYNVAGPGIVYLSQAIRLLGKACVPVPLPLFSPAAGVVRRAGVVDFSPEQLSFLLFGCVGDIGRMRARFGYEPRYSTPQALADFAAARNANAMYDADTAARAERAARDLLAGWRGASSLLRPRR